LDTGVFDDDRYFDVFIEYAKGGPKDILIRITACNRGPQTARIHILPHLWFRNTWSWKPGSHKPALTPSAGGIRTIHQTMGEYTLAIDGDPELLFCENQTNAHRLFGGPPSPTPCKDGINDYVVS